MINNMGKSQIITVLPNNRGKDANTPIQAPLELIKPTEIIKSTEKLKTTINLILEPLTPFLL